MMNQMNVDDDDTRSNDENNSLRFTSNLSFARCATALFCVISSIIVFLYIPSRYADTESIVASNPNTGHVHYHNETNALETKASCPPAISVDTIQTKKSLNEKHPNQETWCPKAQCSNSVLCRPCDRRFLVIIATGRSASTTLTQMMDSLPDLRMSGENNNMLTRMRGIMQNTLHVENFEKYGLQQKNGPWGHNAVPEGSAGCVVQQMIHTMNPPPPGLDDDDSSTILGFKTIRLIESDMTRKKLVIKLKWIREMLPCARFLVNFRSDIDGQAKSQKNAFHKSTETAKEQLEEVDTLIRQVPELLGGTNHAYLLNSTDWTNNIADLNKAVRWLGYNEYCEFKYLLEFNTGNNGYGNGDKLTYEHDPKCALTTK